MDNKQSDSHALFLLLLLGFVWGTGYSIARFAMTNGVPALGYSFWQSLGPAMIITFFALLQGMHFSALYKHPIYYFISALTGIVIPNTCMYFAAPHLPASILALVVNTVPIISYPLALIMGLEIFHWQRLAGIMLAFVGLMMIVIPKTSLPSPAMVPWVLMTLITPFSFALCSMYVARFRPANANALQLSAGMLIFSSLILIPFVIKTGHFYWFQFPMTMPDWVILLEILLSSVGYILFFKLIKIAGPIYYSLVDTIVVLTGLFWGYIIFAEQLNQWTAAAACLILCALILVTQQQRFARLRAQVKWSK